MARDKTRVKRKERKNIASGVAHVNSSFNNTKILISDVQGNAIAWSSSGTMGFKGSRKSTPYAAQMAAEDAGRKAQEHGVKTLDVEVQGPGSGRESAIRSLGSHGLEVIMIKDITNIILPLILICIVLYLSRNTTYTQSIFQLFSNYGFYVVSPLCFVFGVVLVIFLVTKFIFRMS